MTNNIQYEARPKITSEGLHRYEIYNPNTNEVVEMTKTHDSVNSAMNEAIALIKKLNFNKLKGKM